MSDYGRYGLLCNQISNHRSLLALEHLHFCINHSQVTSLELEEMRMFSPPDSPPFSQLLPLLLPDEGVGEGGEGELVELVPGQSEGDGGSLELLGEGTREDSFVISAEH